MSYVRIYTELQHSRAKRDLPSYVLITLYDTVEITVEIKNRVQHQKQKGVHHHAETDDNGNAMFQSYLSELLKKETG